MKEDIKDIHKVPKSAVNHSVEEIAEHAHGSGDDHDHNHGNQNAKWVNNEWLSAIASFILLSCGLILDFFIKPSWFSETIRFVWYATAYLPVGLPVVVKGARLAVRGEIFTEFL